MKNKIAFYLIIGLIIVAGDAFAACERYVTTTGTGIDCLRAGGDECNIYTGIQNASSGEEVCLDDGTYNITSSITVPVGVSVTSTNASSSGVMIQPGASFSTSQPLFSLISSSNTDGNNTISHLTFDGENASNRAYIPIETRQRNHVTIHNCIVRQFYGASRAGININGEWDGIVLSWQDVIPETPGASGNYTGWTGWPDNPATDISIYNNDFIDNGYYQVSGAICVWNIKNSNIHDNHFSVANSNSDGISGGTYWSLSGTTPSSGYGKLGCVDNLDIYRNSMEWGSDVYTHNLTDTPWFIEIWGWRGDDDESEIYENTGLGTYGGWGFSTTYGKDLRIYNNIIYAYRGGENDPYPRGYGVGVEANGISHLYIYDNLIANFSNNITVGYKRGILDGQTIDTIDIRRNVIYNSRYQGIWFKAWNDGNCKTGTVSNGTIVHNTIVGHQGAYRATRNTKGIVVLQNDADGTCGDADITNIDVHDNIVMSYDRGITLEYDNAADVTGESFGTNMMYDTLLADLLGISQGTNINGDPSFTDAGNEDYPNYKNYYSIQSDSNAIAAASGNYDYQDIGAIPYGFTPQNLAPVTLITSPSGPQSGAIDASFSFSGTCTDADGDNVTGVWTFDGAGPTTETFGPSATPLTANAGSETFPSEGTFDVRLTCTDENNASSYQTVQITIGTPSSSSAVHEFNFEAADITDNEGTDGSDLTNNNTVSTGGTEPDPPGYGSVGASFNGTNQYFSLSNADYGANTVLTGTDNEGTIIVALNIGTLKADEYILGAYNTGTDSRQYLIRSVAGQIQVGLGRGSTGYQYLEIDGHTFSASDDIVIGFSLDDAAAEYTLFAQNMTTGTYYTETEADEALTGSLNTSSPDLVIGNRTNLSSTRYFDGIMWWGRWYDDALTLSEMQAIAENTTASGDIDRCYLGEEKVYTTSDTINIYCECTSTTVNKTGGTPYIELETGTSDLQASLQTGDGSGVTLLHFQGTITSGMTADPINATANGIQLNSGSLGGIDDTVATSGPGSIGYESPGASIDTSAGSAVSSMDVCDSDGNEITNDILWRQGVPAYLKICFGADQYFNNGPIGNFALPFQITSGGPLTFFYADNQPAGFGVGNACWLFEAEITSGMSDTDGAVALSSVGDLDRDYITTGTNSVIENINGTDLSSYNMPQVNADDTYKVQIISGGYIYFSVYRYFGAWIDTTAPNIWADTGTTLTWED
jgi:hypothetical protein